MERNGDQEDDLFTADSNSQRHSNEDGMEQNTTLEEHALHGELLALLDLFLLIQGIQAVFALSIEIDRCWLVVVAYICSAFLEIFGLLVRSA